MAKEDEEIDEKMQEEDTGEHFYKISHNLNDGQIIVLRRNTQNYLHNLPEEEQVSLSMVNKKGDNALYFKSTKTRAIRILERLERHAKDWSYTSANLRMEVVEEEPEKMLDAEDFERLEEKISESYKEEQGRLHMTIGGLNTELARAKDDLKEQQNRATAAEEQNRTYAVQIERMKETIESLKDLNETLAKGTLADACMKFIQARAENVEILELLLADIKESGLDIGFISNPPDTVERYAKEKLMRTLDVEYRDLERCLEIGKADTWEESRLFTPKEDADSASDKLEKLAKSIETADESIKGILEENLKTVIGTLNSAVQEYSAKKERYLQARQTYREHKKAIEQGIDELAKAKQLKTSLSDLRKMKFPVYAVPEQDGATIYLPITSGIAYDSVINAIKTHAHIKSEEEISGNTVLRIGGDGEWNPIKILKSIKDSYENNTEAGKIGSKLGLLVQF